MDWTPRPERRPAVVAWVLYSALCGPALAEAVAPVWFEEVSEALGIDFLHQDGRSGERYYVETTASGGGFLDFDGDGDLDLYLVNGAQTPGRRLDPEPRDALYENRDGRFHEVTQEAGVGAPGYGMGLCAGDIEGDGHVDFLVTSFGPDRLYRNRGDGTFEEIAQRAGVAGRRWSGSCAFGDLDGDGDLDLYVTHYVDFAFDRNPICGDATAGRRRYCLPEAFSGVPDALYINRGDGTFDEQGARRGIVQEGSEKGMGVRPLDLEPDGDLDLYVANDGAANRLYVNDGSGHFEDQGLISGTGLDALGAAQASMGIAVGDIDEDGDPDLVLSHFAMEANTYYRNLGGLFFEDETRRTVLAGASLRQVGWGIELFDADNDGDLDLAVANGHIEDQVDSDEPLLRYRQANQLFENLGGGTFREVGAEAGPGFTRERVSRGLAVGDWNDDGRLDLLITNTNDRPDLLLNRRETGNRWLGLRLVGAPANPLAIGARVVLTAGDRTQVREVSSGGSLQSQSDLRPHFGLGRHAGEVTVTIRWPDGRFQTATTDELDRYWTLRYQPDPSR